MNKLKYEWQIGESIFTGTGEFESEEALKTHLDKIGGKLVRILSQEKIEKQLTPVQLTPVPEMNIRTYVLSIQKGAYLQVGQKVEAFSNNYPGKIFNGIVEKLTTNTVTVKIDNKDNLLQDGMDLAFNYNYKKQTINPLLGLAMIAGAFWLGNKLVPTFTPLYQKDKYGILR